MLGKPLPQDPVKAEESLDDRLSKNSVTASESAARRTPLPLTGLRCDVPAMTTTSFARSWRKGRLSGQPRQLPPPRAAEKANLRPSDALEKVLCALEEECWLRRSRLGVVGLCVFRCFLCSPSRSHSRLPAEATRGSAIDDSARRGRSAAGLGKRSETSGLWLIVLSLLC